MSNRCNNIIFQNVPLALIKACRKAIWAFKVPIWKRASEISSSENTFTESILYPKCLASQLRQNNALVARVMAARSRAIRWDGPTLTHRNLTKSLPLSPHLPHPARTRISPPPPPHLLRHPCISPGELEHRWSLAPQRRRTRPCPGRHRDGGGREEQRRTADGSERPWSSAAWRQRRMAPSAAAGLASQLAYSGRRRPAYSRAPGKGSRHAPNPDELPDAAGSRRPRTQSRVASVADE
jgi:hypothetical protein